MMNPFLSAPDEVRVWAHQGGEYVGPPSTLWTIREALRLGATGIELDVHAGRDGLVVHHDETLLRATGQDIVISMAEVREMKRHDPGRFHVPGRGIVHGGPEAEYSFRGRHENDDDFKLATLPEVLELLQGTGATISIDLKQRGYVTQVVDTVFKHGMGEQTIFGSFSDSTVAEIKQLRPEAHTMPGQLEVVKFACNPWLSKKSGHSALLIPPTLRIKSPQMIRKLFDTWRSKGRLSELLESSAVYSGSRAEAPRTALRLGLTKTHVRLAHQFGLGVHMWTIDTVGEMDRLMNMGVDGIISNRPSLAVELAKERHVKGLRPTRGFGL